MKNPKIKHKNINGRLQAAQTQHHFWVYLLKSMNYPNQIYIGSTNNLKKRLEDHNNGKVFSTKRYAPWLLYYYEAYQNEKLARLREKRLKYNGNAVRELKKRIGLLSADAELLTPKSGAGQMMLSLIFLIGGVIITIGVALSILGFSFITSITGYRAAILAEAAASSGANDAILQVVRNANFSSTGYTLPFTNVSDIVTATQGTPSANETTIISLAQIRTIKQKIQVILSIDPVSKKVDVVSYQKIPI